MPVNRVDSLNLMGLPAPAEGNAPGVIPTPIIMHPHSGPGGGALSAMEPVLAAPAAPGLMQLPSFPNLAGVSCVMSCVLVVLCAPLRVMSGAF